MVEEVKSKGTTDSHKMHLLYIRVQMLETADLPSFEEHLQKVYIPPRVSLFSKETDTGASSAEPMLCLKNMMNTSSTNIASEPPSYLVAFNCKASPADLHLDLLLPEATHWHAVAKMTVRAYGLLQA